MNETKAQKNKRKAESRSEIRGILCDWTQTSQKERSAWEKTGDQYKAAMAQGYTNALFDVIHGLARGKSLKELRRFGVGSGSLMAAALEKLAEIDLAKEWETHGDSMLEALGLGDKATVHVSGEKSGHVYPLERQTKDVQAIWKKAVAERRAQEAK